MTPRPPDMSPYSVQYPTASSDLLPVVSSKADRLFDSAISRLPRMRAWMFSSVTSRAVPANAPASVRSIASMTSSMGSVSVRMPRLAASASESSMLPRLEKGDGIRTPST